jgi:hypothetical protein
LVTKEKRNRKETTKRKTQTSDRKPLKGKEQYHLKEESLGPLGKGNDSTEPKHKHAQAKSRNHQSNARKPQRAPPAHMQAPPELMQLPLDECMQTTSRNRAAAIAQL